MNNCIYDNEFSLSAIGYVQVRRFVHLPGLVQPIAALLSIGRAFSLHLWCSLALLIDHSFHYEDTKTLLKTLE
jgi:hypothetical protein